MQSKSKAVESFGSEEIANVVTHSVGMVLFIVGSAALVIKASQSQNVLKILSAIIFGGSLVLMYTASTIYHAMSTTKWGGRLRLLDHAAIFILIAGTYTPFLLVALKDHVHVSFIIIMWSIAFVGIIYKLFAIRKFKVVSTLIYLAMGWMAVFKIRTFYDHLSIEAMIWIVAGGLFYSLGTIFYSKESMRYHHAIWHLFVLCGSVSHFVAIYLYVY
jgi:hemolysin III